MGFGSNNGAENGHVEDHAMDNPLRIDSNTATSTDAADDFTPRKSVSSPRDEPLLTFDVEDSDRGRSGGGGGLSTFDVEDGERSSQRRRGKSGSSSEGRKVDHLFATPAFQEKCRHLVHNALFEAMVTTIVLTNTIALAYKGPNRVLSPAVGEALDTFDFVCTVLYTMEMCVRIAAYGAVDGRNYEDAEESEDIPLQKRALLRDPWGRLDFFIIVMSWVSYAIEAMGLDETTIKTSMLRSLRVLRILHSIQYFKSIRAILTSLQYSVEYRACPTHALSQPGSSVSHLLSLTAGNCDRSGGCAVGATFPLRVMFNRGDDTFWRCTANSLCDAGGS